LETKTLKIGRTKNYVFLESDLHQCREPRRQFKHVIPFTLHLTRSAQIFKRRALTYAGCWRCSSGASPGKKCGVDARGERREREPITGVWGEAPAESRGRAHGAETENLTAFGRPTEAANSPHSAASQAPNVTGSLKA